MAELLLQMSAIIAPTTEGSAASSKLIVSQSLSVALTNHQGSGDARLSIGHPRTQRNHDSNDCTMVAPELKDAKNNGDEQQWVSSNFCQSTRWFPLESMPLVSGVNVTENKPLVVGRDSGFTSSVASIPPLKPVRRLEKTVSMTCSKSDYNDCPESSQHSLSMMSSQFDFRQNIIRAANLSLQSRRAMHIQLGNSVGSSINSSSKNPRQTDSSEELNGLPSHETFDEEDAIEAASIFPRSAKKSLLISISNSLSRSRVINTESVMEVDEEQQQQQQQLEQIAVTSNTPQNAVHKPISMNSPSKRNESKSDFDNNNNENEDEESQSFSSSYHSYPSNAEPLPYTTLEAGGYSIASNFCRRHGTKNEKAVNTDPLVCGDDCHEIKFNKKFFVGSSETSLKCESQFSIAEEQQRKSKQIEQSRNEFSIPSDVNTGIHNEEVQKNRTLTRFDETYRQTVSIQKPSEMTLSITPRSKEDLTDNTDNNSYEAQTRSGAISFSTFLSSKQSSRLSGWVSKRSSNLLVGWQDRWLVLKSKRLQYFKQTSSTNYQGCIDFSLLPCALTRVFSKKNVLVELRLAVNNSSKVFRFRSSKKAGAKLQITANPRQQQQQPQQHSRNPSAQEQGPVSLERWGDAIERELQICQVDSSIPLTIHLLKQKKFWKSDRVSLQEFQSLADTGDLILFKGKTFGDSILRNLIGCEYNHVGMVLRTSNEDNNLLVLEATGGEGVGLLSWKTFLKRNWHLLYHKISLRKLQAERTDCMLTKMEQFIRYALGKPYNVSLSKILGVSNKPETDLVEDPNRTYFCSELIATIYKICGFLPLDQSSSKYWPSSFEGSRNLLLQSDASLSEEFLLDFAI